MTLIITDDHENRNRWIDETGEEKQRLIEHEKDGDVLVEIGKRLPFLEQEDLVGQRRRNPAPPLLEELVELLRTVGAVARRGAVLQPPTALHLNHPENNSKALSRSRKYKLSVTTKTGVDF